MQRPDQTWTQGKDSFLPSLGRLLDDAWPYGPKDHWLKTTWVFWNWNESGQLTTQDSGIQNATKAQKIVEFSAAHRARNTLAARIWFPFFSWKIDTFVHYFHIFCISSSKKSKKKEKKKRKKKRETKRKKRLLTSRNIFSIENQMQVIPLARNPREKKEKKEKRKKKKKNRKKQKKTCHRFAICTQSPLCNACLENCSQKSCCSDL